MADFPAIVQSAPSLITIDPSQDDVPGTPFIFEKTTNTYLMQAADSVSGILYRWISATPDWTGASYSGPNSPTEIVMAAYK